MAVRTYSQLIVVLVVAGGAISSIGYILAHNNSLLVLGITFVIVAMSAALLPEKIEASGAMSVLLQSAAYSTNQEFIEIEANGGKIREINEGNVVIELTSEVHHEDSEAKPGLSHSAIYLPPRDGTVYVFLPLNCDPTGMDFHELSNRSPASLWKALSQDMKNGLLVVPVGARLPLMSGIERTENDDDIVRPLEKILIDSTGLCTSIGVTEIENVTILELNGVRTNLEQNTYYCRYLGSIPSSLAACIMATVRNQSIVILDERIIGKRIICRFRLG